MERIDHPIPPLYDGSSRILILGSFPSVKSREAMFFYGHPQNRFWPVLAAVLVYFAAQVYNYFADPMTITLVYEAQAEDVISMEGWLVRTEEPLPGQIGTVSRAVQEGQRVAAGETVATVYSDDSALQTVSRIETLELQLQQLQFALTSYLDPDAALKLDTSITGDILTLRQTLSAGDYAAAESDLAALKAAVLKRDHGAYTSQEDIQAQITAAESRAVRREDRDRQGLRHLFRRVRRVRERTDGGVSGGRDAGQAERREGGGGAEQRGQADLRRHLVLCGGAAGRAGGGAEGYGPGGCASGQGL